MRCQSAFTNLQFISFLNDFVMKGRLRRIRFSLLFTFVLVLSFLWFLNAGNDSCCSRPLRSNSTKYQIPKNDQSRIWCSLNKYLVAKRNEKYQKRCKIPNDQPESCWVSADQVMHHYQLQDRYWLHKQFKTRPIKEEKKVLESPPDIWWCL